MYTEHSEYASQLGFLRQFATHDLLPVYGQLCALYTNQLVNTLSKRKAHISGRQEKQTYF